MVRSRMVMLGTTQAFGAVAGVVLAVVVGMLPSVRIGGYDKEFSSQPLAAIFLAFLYAILLPGSLYSFPLLTPIFSSPLLPPFSLCNSSSSAETCSVVNDCVRGCRRVDDL